MRERVEKEIVHVYFWNILIILIKAGEYLFSSSLILVWNCIINSKKIKLNSTRN